MAFAYTVDEQFMVGGSLRKAVGTFTSDGSSTGGEIKTGLQHVKSLVLTAAASSVGNAPVANVTVFPVNTGDITIVTDSNEVGCWEAMGY